MSMIRIHGAKQNNLKNISVDIPKHQITVFTGRSGSGKSSLVLNTIAAESERLLNETYSTYIQHQLAQFSKPKVDLIEHFGHLCICEITLVTNWQTVCWLLRYLFI